MGAACAEGAEGAVGAESAEGVQRPGHVGARAAKAVDGLVVVAHRGQRDHAARRQQLQQLCSRGAEAQRYTEAQGCGRT